MEITWYGLSCFKLTERSSATVVTDPYEGLLDGQEPLKLAADIITLNHPSPGQNHLNGAKKTPYVIAGPGEYEISGVFITGIQTGGHKSTVQNEPKNTLYVFDFDSLTIAHLGDLDRVLTQSEVEAMGTVNVALVPIGSERGFNAARAAEVIQLLEPNIIVPMHYLRPGNIPLEILNKFLKEMGVNEVEKRPSLKITRDTLPEETQIITLDYHPL